ncbi:hypothetical protein ES288_A02G128400v1 [Gossypium darwinii]|uniref:Uncharacterized protein n=1 Tax=Gossypium darwinii TaxID=34276 RepID=A0A5D2HDC1_GOSDA|nr:hypothetical protein ES288_A02G128400v1 [Gossypium darwinii]
MLGFHLTYNCRTTIIFGGRWCANSNPILPTEEPDYAQGKLVSSTVRRGGRGNGAGDPC